MTICQWYITIYIMIEREPDIHTLITPPTVAKFFYFMTEIGDEEDTIGVLYGDNPGGEVKGITLLPENIEKVNNLARFIISGPSIVPPGFDCEITLDPFHENGNGGTIKLKSTPTQ